MRVLAIVVSGRPGLKATPSHRYREKSCHPGGSEGAECYEDVQLLPGVPGWNS